MSFFNELKRRNVFRVGIVYVVVSWLIMQVADVILNNIEAPDWVFSVILLLLVIGFPLIMLFAWAFELTPEGLKRDHEVDRSRSVTPQTGKKLDRLIIVMLALAVGYFAFDKFVISPKPDVTGTQASTQAAAESDATEAGIVAEREKSIGVLPLVNRSAREEDKYFTDGMHDDLLTQLSKVASLKVISRTSVMRYRDTELTIPEIADQLGVSTILEGGVQRSGDQIRVNVQLIDAKSDQHLWAESYDRKMTAENLFAIQSEITQRIVDSLRATLTPSEAARISAPQTNNLEAFEEYMKGQQVLTLRTVPALEQGKAHFERALELDAKFAEAIVGLANALHLLHEYAGWPAAESLNPAMDLIARALELDPDLGEAYMVRGEIFRHRRDYESAEVNFDKAIALIPGNATVFHWFSFVRSQQNQVEEAHALLRRAHELNPMSAVIHVAYALQPFYIGRDEETLAELARVKVIHPEYPLAYSTESWVYRSHGDPVGSLRDNLKVLEIDPGNSRASNYCFDYINLNARDEALGCVAQEQGVNAMAKAFIQVHVNLMNGDHEAAQAALESSMAAEDVWRLRGQMAVSVGRYDVAWPLFEQQYPEWFADSGAVRVKPDEIDGAIDTALILENEGESNRAMSLLTAALEAMEPLARNRGDAAYGLADVSAYALLGQKDKALDALEECARLEYLTGWQGLNYLARYDSIREEPRFIAAVTRLSAAADAARDRARSAGLLE